MSDNKPAKREEADKPEVIQPGALAATAHRELDIYQLRNRINIIQHLIAEVLKDGVHYYSIGYGKGKALGKAGAEYLMLLFGLHLTDVEVEDLSTDTAVRYRVTTRIRDGHGYIVGVGMGECSSAEAKYAWRRVICDEEWEDTPKDKRRKKWEEDGTYILQVATTPADNANCVTPDTLILTRDLQWVPAGEIETGDQLIGVEEDMTNEYARHLATGEATVHGRRTDLLYEIRFKDGRAVRCNGEHQWLVRKVGLKGTEWVSTQEIHEETIERKGRPRKWTVISLCQPWAEDQSKEAGYIAGLLDADGCLTTKQMITSFSQQQNTVLALIQRGLTTRGFRFGLHPHKTQEKLDQTKHGKQVYNLRINGGFAEQLRILGTIRPPRLLDRWLGLGIGQRRLEGKGSGAGKPVEIASIKSVGEGEIVMLSTTCRTYIAAGLVCHNTVLKMAKKRSMVDAVLTGTAASDCFEQDLEEDGYPVSGRDKKSRGKSSKPTAQKGKADHVDTIAEVTVKKTGKGKQGDWTIHRIVAGDGTAYETFDDKLAGVAKELAGQGVVVTMKWEPASNPKFAPKLVGIEDGPSGDQGPPPPSDDDAPPPTDADAPPDENGSPAPSEGLSRGDALENLKAERKRANLTWDEIAEIAKRTGAKSLSSKKWTTEEIQAITAEIP